MKYCAQILAFIKSSDEDFIELDDIIGYIFELLLHSAIEFPAYTEWVELESQRIIDSINQLVKDEIIIEESSDTDEKRIFRLPVPVEIAQIRINNER